MVKKFKVNLFGLADEVLEVFIWLEEEEAVLSDRHQAVNIKKIIQ
jgi:hypothetical protein